MKKVSNIKRNWDYIVENFRILAKVTVEYKFNFLSSIFVQLIYFAITIGIYLIITNNLGQVFGWTKWDFILFIILQDTIWCFSGLFFWDKNLFDYIKKGDLNKFILRPINPFKGYFFSKLNTTALIMLVMNIPILILLFYYLEIPLIKIGVVIIMSLFIMIQYDILNSLYESFNFHYLGSSQYIREINNSLESVMRIYPTPFYSKFRYKYFLTIVTTFYVGSILIPYIMGYEIWNLKLQILIYFTINIIAGLIVYYNWHYGLKKYEAFG